MTSATLSTSTVTQALIDAAILALDGIVIDPAGIAQKLAQHAYDDKHAFGQADIDSAFGDLMDALGAFDQDFSRVYSDVMAANRNS